jgi:hypothetical protein
VTKRETRRAKLLELWDDDEEVLEALKEEIPKAVLEQYDYDEALHEAEAVLIYLGSSQETFYEKTCVQCGKPFFASYARVTTCSTRCIKKILESYGIDFDPSKSPEERWRPNQDKWNPRPVKGKKESQKDYDNRLNRWKDQTPKSYPVPLIVPPEAVQVLQDLGLEQNHPVSPEQEETAS